MRGGVRCEVVGYGGEKVCEGGCCRGLLRRGGGGGGGG